MTKTDWKNLYDKLNLIYFEFIKAYYDNVNGKTDKIKREGNEKAHLYIEKSISILSLNEKSYRLIFDNQEANNLRDSIILEDFKKPQCFDKSMEYILERIYRLT